MYQETCPKIKHPLIFWACVAIFGKRLPVLDNRSLLTERQKIFFCSFFFLFSSWLIWENNRFSPNNSQCHAIKLGNNSSHAMICASNPPTLLSVRNELALCLVLSTYYRREKKGGNSAGMTFSLTFSLFSSCFMTLIAVDARLLHSSDSSRGLKMFSPCCCYC